MTFVSSRYSQAAGGAVIAVMLAQDPGEHRHRLFAAVFLIRRDEYDVPAFARSLATLRDRLLPKLLSGELSLASSL